MNCPKCNSPLNDGDKFCQVCGSVVDNAAPQQAPVVEATPEVVQAPQPMAQPAPMPSPMPMGQPAPMPGQVPMNNQMPMGAVPGGPAKKNNTIVIVLGVVIALLAILIVVLFVTGGKDDDKGGNDTGNTNPGTSETTGDNDKDDDDGKNEEPPKVDTSTKTVVGGFTITLPEGYNATMEDDTVIVFDDNNQVQATLQTMDAYLSQVSSTKVKSNMEGIGVTGITSRSYTKNGKQMLIFTGLYQGYTVEFIYANYESGKLIGSVAMYSMYDTHKENIYDIITKVVVSSSGFTSTPNYPLPGLTLEDAIK